MGKGGKLAQVEGKDAFFLSYTDEPHASRRKLILAKHPEIEQLFGNDPRPIPLVILLVLSQLVLAYYSNQMSWVTFILVTWVYGGGCNHVLSLMTHELSHNLVFKSKRMNELFGIFCNIGMGIPSSTIFKRYHMEHHRFQGYEGKDVDLPTVWEGQFFQSPLMKALYVFLQPVFYGLRPGVVRPKKATQLDKINIYIVIVTNAIIYSICGSTGLAYILLSLYLGMGLHPVAGHLIAEHYVFLCGHETYSYYGPLNILCWNVGYHNEHHDFPRIPGWKLPLVKKIAPEFYDNLPHHRSWTLAVWQFITDPNVTPFNRVIRRSTDATSK